MPNFIPITRSRDNLGGCIVGFYDFEQHGGAVGAIPLGVNIPDNAVITQCLTDVIIPFTSGGAATVALGLETADDLVTAAGFATFTGAQMQKAQADAFKLTAAQELTLTVGTAALTAGRMAIEITWSGPYDDVVAVET